MLDALDICSQIRDRCGAAFSLVHHLNKTGTQSGSRALMTRADLLVEGSDGDEPLYTSRGRTIRHKDAIRTGFQVVVEHEDDDDDKIAKTRVGLRFDGERANKHALSKTAEKARGALAETGSPMTARAIGRKARITNGQELSKALKELQDAGIARIDVKDGKRGWTLTTTSFFEALGDKPPRRPRWAAVLATNERLENGFKSGFKTHPTQVCLDTPFDTPLALTRGVSRYAYSQHKTPCQSSVSKGPCQTCLSLKGRHGRLTHPIDPPSTAS